MATRPGGGGGWHAAATEDDELMFELERDSDGAELAAPADGAPEPPADLCVESPCPCAPRDSRQRVTFEAKVVRDAGSTNNTNNANNANNANELDADTVLAIMVRLVAGGDEIPDPEFDILLKEDWCSLNLDRMEEGEREAFSRNLKEIRLEELRSEFIRAGSRALSKCACVCRTWYACSLNVDLWLKLLFQQWGEGARQADECARYGQGTESLPSYRAQYIRSETTLTLSWGHGMYT